MGSHSFSRIAKHFLTLEKVKHNRWRLREETAAKLRDFVMQFLWLWKLKIVAWIMKNAMNFFCQFIGRNNRKLRRKNIAARSIEKWRQFNFLCLNQRKNWNFSSILFLFNPTRIREWHQNKVPTVFVMCCVTSFTVQPSNISQAIQRKRKKVIHGISA